MFVAVIHSITPRKKGGLEVHLAVRALLLASSYRVVGSGLYEGVGDYSSPVECVPELLAYECSELLLFDLAQGVC